MSYPNNNEAARQTQFMREVKMHNDGVGRANSRREKQAHLSKVSSNHAVIEDAIPLVAAALDAAIEAEKSKAQGRKFLWVTLLENIDTMTLAYIGLNCMMDTVGQKGTMTTSATSIGNRIETEHWAVGLNRFALKDAKELEKQAIARHQTEYRRLEAVKVLSALKGYSRKKWDLKRRVTAAMPVLNAVLEFAGIFYIHEEYTKKRTMKYIRILPEVLKSINTTDAEASWQQPMFGASIIPVKPWTSFDTGVYLDERLSGLVPLVKDATYKQRQFVERDFARCKAEGKLPEYVEAINAMQEVPLAINNDVLEAVRWAWREGKEFKRFPKSRLLSVPERLADWGNLSRKEQMRHVSSCKKIREKNDATDSAIIVMNRDLASAAELGQYDQFYLGWNLDTRCRVYPVSHFNFHRDDHIKAMFEFANKKPLSADSDEWLMIHIANLGDFDKTSKKSLEDRVLWFKENEDTILSVFVSLEKSFDFWSAADKPFQFYAACVEWAKYKIFGDGYMSSMGPALDGSCSGVQHYSAASLSQETGALVNLVPSANPQDVYQTLADEVVEVLEAISKGKPKGHEDKKLADLWLTYGVGRSELKTPCMTYCYSSRPYGMAEQIKKQIMEDLTEKILHSDEPLTHHFGDLKEQNAASKFLADISFTSVQKVLSAAKEGMEFFQECAGALAKENKPISWRTPIGFPVTQKKTRWKSEKVKVYLYDRTAKVKKRAQISLNSPDVDTICLRQSKSGISPNIIHSMDSSHLLSTVLALKDNGINDFMMIHDSFAVPCESSWDLFSIVRETFKEQYSDFCLYTMIYDATLEQLSDTSPIDNLQIPTKGHLDLNGIAESDFCFA